MNIGDYVRGSGYDYGIKQIKQIDKYGNLLFYTKEQNYLPDIDNSSEPQYIKKSSPNIIDLIEVGDYVNGYKVQGIYDDDIELDYIEDHTYLDYDYDDNAYIGGEYETLSIKQEDIREILTHEQYENNCYKVGE